MAAVHILIFGEMAVFKIIPFIATHVKMIFFFHGAMKKFFSQSELASCMKTTDIKLFKELREFFLFHGAMKKNSANQNSAIFMKTTDIKL